MHNSVLKAKLQRRRASCSYPLETIKKAHCYGMWKVSPVSADYRDNTEKTTRYNCTISNHMYMKMLNKDSRNTQQTEIKAQP